MSWQITAAGACHIGLRRERNEDFLLIGNSAAPHLTDRPRAVGSTIDIGETAIMVAAIDGMGGHPGGDLASQAVATHLRDSSPVATDMGNTREVLQDANKALYELGRQPGNEWLTGAGATIAGVSFAGDQAIWFNVGDSRVYCQQDGYLTQLSQDDSPLGPESGRGSSVVLQTIGGSESFRSIDPHVGERRLHDGMRFIICTDGLTDLVDDARIEQTSGLSAPAAVESLLSDALEAGGVDNVTVAVVDVMSAETL